MKKLTNRFFNPTPPITMNRTSRCLPLLFVPFNNSFVSPYPCSSTSQSSSHVRLQICFYSNDVHVLVTECFDLSFGRALACAV